MAVIDVSSNALLDPVFRGINDVLPKLPAALVALLFGLIVIRILSWTGDAIIGLMRMPRGLKGILGSMLDTLLWIFLIVSVLQTLGLSSIALIFSGSLAAVGLALGFGASTLAADILAGVFLAQDRDFSVGDEVRAGDPPIDGVVESMDMRRTRIRGTDGKLHIMPNSVIERKEWVVLAKKKDRV